MRYLSAPIGNIEIAFGNSDRVDRTELEVTFGELVPTVPFSVFQCTGIRASATKPSNRPPLHDLENHPAQGIESSGIQLTTHVHKTSRQFPGR